MIFHWIAAILMTITAAAHSTLSETRLMPALPPGGLVHTIIRYALHAMSVFMLLSAISMVWPGLPSGLAATIGWGWILVGLSGFAMTKGKHLGWPVITGAGIAAVLGAWL